MPDFPYQHLTLARFAHRIDASDLADAEALIERSNAEHLTGPELARVCGIHPRTLYAALATAGRSRSELWTPPKAPRGAKRKIFDEWELLQRDYEAGDTPHVLADRYGLHQQVIERNLKSVEGLHVRSRTEAVELRSSQRAEADSVRYRLRTGALEKAADQLGVDPSALRSALEQEGLILHDLN